MANFFEGFIVGSLLSSGKDSGPREPDRESDKIEVFPVNAFMFGIQFVGILALIWTVFWVRDFEIYLPIGPRGVTVIEAVSAILLALMGPILLFIRAAGRDPSADWHQTSRHFKSYLESWWMPSLIVTSMIAVAMVSGYAAPSWSGIQQSVLIALVPAFLAMVVPFLTDAIPQPKYHDTRAATAAFKHDFALGDLVGYRGGCNVLSDGVGRSFPTVVVIETSPLILASRDGLMRWSDRFDADQLVRLGRAPAGDYDRAMTRLEK